MNTAIKIRDLHKTYKGGFQALKGINLTIREGVFYGLLGPNGAGKTTTINILTGLVRITSGTVTVLGQDVIKNYRQTRKSIGLAPQDLNFDPFFSIRQMLTLHAGYYGYPVSKAKDRADMMLKQFGLSEKAEKSARELSGGMKRRLQIAKSLVHDPPIVILDEPTAGVDIELRYMLWDYLKLINKEGKTILLTTHYIFEAEYLCETVAIIDNGKLVTEGKPEQLIQELGSSYIDLKVNSWDGNNDLGDWQYSQHENRLHIRTEHPEVDIPRIIAKVTEAGAFIEEVKTHKKSLEDVFIQLTGKSIDV